MYELRDGATSDFIEAIARQRTRWAIGLPENWLSKQLLYAKLMDSTRGRGGPCKRFKDKWKSL